MAISGPQLPAPAVVVHAFDSDDIEVVRAEGRRYQAENNELRRRPRLDIDSTGVGTLHFGPPFELQGRLSGIVVHCQVDSREVGGNARTKNRLSEWPGG